MNLKSNVDPWNVEVSYVGGNDVPEAAPVKDRRGDLKTVLENVAKQIGDFQVTVENDGSVKVGKKEPVKTVVVPEKKTYQMPELPYGLTWNKVAAGVGVGILAYMLFRR